MYAVYHGATGLKHIASRIHLLAAAIAASLQQLGVQQNNASFFDTIHLSGVDAAKVKAFAEQHQCNFRYFNDRTIGITIDETTSIEEANTILQIFELVTGKTISEKITANSIVASTNKIPDSLWRTSSYLTHPVFNTHHSESQMMRYIKQLENKDLSLNTSMISLGSCTMKLNAATEMIPVSWPEFGGLHPFAPANQTAGYQQIIDELNQYLCAVTGFTACSLQPNSGAQGEYAGLLTIRAYHKSRNEVHRNIVLIPISAHGTNPASAVMAGFKVVVIKCDEAGNIDVADLKEKAELHKNNLGGLMVTYPSTHGVFEETIKDICAIIHENGGLVYMDGANMNAQVGLTNPATIGADVCHLNLHKTFAIPHGGGGPGVGPICVNEKLVPFLPTNPIINVGGDQAITAISAAPYGSALVCLISYGYIKMLGAEGLKSSTEHAILNANYMKARLEEHYPVLYSGEMGRAAHEMILDCRSFKQKGIEVTDIAKRLMDYGFHAPTVSFPVAGTLMIEPTESEDLAELDRFCDAMISIRKEIERTNADDTNNVLKNAPHTLAMLTSDTWIYPYTREQAAYPLDYIHDNKFWPSVRRIDDAYGDRNLVCSCAPIEAYM
jgi:glycine dehydrogenase